MIKRRELIAVVPLAGVSALAACSDKASAPAPAPAVPAPTPAAPPPAAPAAPAPAPAPAAPAPAAAPAAGAMVDPKDPAAMALGYVAVASEADTTRFKTYAAGQTCANCALYVGKAGDASGACPLFGGKQVAAIGWCSAYSKKTG